MRISSRPLALLALSIFLGVVAALYPYSPCVNPEGRGVGVDIHYYVDNGELVEKDIFQSFTVMKGSRPTIFLLIYGFQKFIGSDVSTAVKFLPVILNPLMIASAFFLAYEAFGDEWIAGWTAFFTACGYQITVGMYSYFLTNMLALSLAFLSVGFLFRSLRRGCDLSLFLAVISGTLLVFTHPWTFVQYIATMILTIIVSLYRAQKENDGYEKIKSSLLYIAFLVLADICKMLLLQGTGAILAFSTTVSRISIPPKFWLDSIFGFRLLYGGGLSVVILIGLAVLGVYLIEISKFSKIYFAVVPITISFVFIIGSGFFKSRLLYNISIGLFAAIGMSSLSRWKFKDNLKKCFILFVVLNLTVYLFRSLANLI